MSERLNKKIELCDIEEGDRDLLIDIYHASRETELEMVPWDAAQKRLFCEHQFEAQAKHYREHYPAAEHRLIAAEGEKCGRLYLNRGKQEYAILDITVLPAFRRRGIGGQVLDHLVEDADRAGSTVRVYVDDFSPHRTFFLNRGFTEDRADDGRILLRRLIK